MKKLFIATLIVSGMFLAACGEGTKPLPQPTATPTPSTSTKPIDTSGINACDLANKPRISDISQFTTEQDFSYWATEVSFVASEAKFSINENISRAGEDLEGTLKGDTFIPNVVHRALLELRKVCDQERYINLPLP